MESEKILLRSQDGAIARLTLNRPKAGNSLSIELLDELYHQIHALGQDKNVSVIVLTATGSVFCAGHDLKELTAARAGAGDGETFFEKTFSKCARVMMEIVNCPKPVIAQVQGTATAAGCQLVASCDLAVASDAAKFATPGVNIGLFCSTPMVALSRNVHRKVAMQMLLTGEPLNAEQAVQAGLLNSVVAPQDLAAETDALARKIASKSARTVKIGKEAFYKQLEQPLEAAYDYTSAVMVANMMEEDAVEGINAFIEKRAPNFKG